MTDRDPHQPNQSHDPGSQTGENKGRIKQPQQETPVEKNLPRGSEPETHARK